MPAGVEGVLYFEEIEGFACYEVDEVVDGLGVQVQAWVAGGDDGAGLGEGLHVVDVDEAQGGFSVADYERPAFFEGDGGGSCQEV